MRRMGTHRLHVGAFIKPEAAEDGAFVLKTLRHYAIVSARSHGWALPEGWELEDMRSELKTPNAFSRDKAPIVWAHAYVTVITNQS